MSDPVKSISIVALDNGLLLFSIERYQEELAIFAVPRADAARVVSDYQPALISPRGLMKMLADEETQQRELEPSTPQRVVQPPPPPLPPPLPPARSGVLTSESPHSPVTGRARRRTEDEL